MSLRILLIFSLMTFCSLFLTAQTTGRVIEGLSLSSKLMDQAVNYAVYLPPGYDQSTRSYPVVYLLHGYSDDESAWIQFGEVQLTADQAIAERAIPPMIIVMPDAKLTWYLNNHDSTVLYEDMFIKELLPSVEKAYRIRGEKEFRGICGLSMGGYGALIYAMKHPDLFAATAPLSAALYTAETVLDYEQGRWDRVEGPIYGPGLVGQDRLTDHWKANNPFYLLKTMDIEQLQSVRYYFDCGDDDFLFQGNAEIHMQFNDLDIPHEFRVRDGAHNWTYWRTGIKDALAFIGESFHR
ncbi:MAG: alpha/beta hydrolase family protein [Bacteroidota bacterium]